MNTQSPPPRMVPDRPSDAVLSAANAVVIAASAKSVLAMFDAAERLGRALAAAPPAEAPAVSVLDALKLVRSAIDASDKPECYRDISAAVDGWIAGATVGEPKLAAAPAGEARSRDGVVAYHIKQGESVVVWNDNVANPVKGTHVFLAAPAAPAGEEGGHVPVSPEEEARIDEAAGLEKISFRVSIDTAILLRREAKARGLAFPAYLRAMLAAAPAPDTAGDFVDAYVIETPTGKGLRWSVSEGDKVLATLHYSPRVTGGREWVPPVMCACTDDAQRRLCITRDKCSRAYALQAATGGEVES